MGDNHIHLLFLIENMVLNLSFPPLHTIGTKFSRTVVGAEATPHPPTHSKQTEESILNLVMRSTNNIISTTDRDLISKAWNRSQQNQ